MEEEYKEKILDDYPLPVSIEDTIEILKQMQKCICKISNIKGKGTGFFCCIPYQNKNIPVMMTNNHIIDEDILKDKIIFVTINDDKEKKKIEISNRKIYTNQEYDITIIEIKPEIDEINDFLEIDNNIFDEAINICMKVYIYRNIQELEKNKKQLQLMEY